MSSNESRFSRAAPGTMGFALVLALFAVAGFARAAEPAATPGCSCPKLGSLAPQASKSVDLTPKLDEFDEIAALESVTYALTEVADGASYIWRRSHGRLSGVVKPISSFKDTHGAVCRHAAVVLSDSKETKRTEIVACRLPTGIWQLEG